MNLSDFDLAALGFDAHFAALVAPEDLAARRVGRVVEVQRGGALVALPGQPGAQVWAKPRARLFLAEDQAAAQPAVGDFVVLAAASGDGFALIERMLPRRTALVRAAVGSQGGAQVIAANLDLVFIATALDQDFSERRVERYVAAAWSSGALPAVILTKADLHAGSPEFVAECVRKIAAAVPGVPVIAVSALNGEAENLSPVLALAQAGKTLALVGSSGVGKSTLVNALLGQTVLATCAVRDSDGKGRHTTTSRQMFVLPGGAIVIDTPGMREFAPFDAVEGVSQVFGDVEELAAACRFSDCQHRDEPGCAIKAALADGSLDQARLASFNKLMKEQAYQARKQNARLSAETQQKWKRNAREQRQKKKLRL